MQSIGGFAAYRDPIERSHLAGDAAKGDHGLPTAGNLTIAHIVGTDIAHAVPLTLVAGLGHLAAGAVNLSLLISLVIGSVPGIIAGSLVAPRAPERVLRLVLALILTVVGVRLALR